MSTITVTGPIEQAATESKPAPRLLRTGLAAGVVASVATSVTAVAARAAGVDLAIAGEQIPLNGFATLTMVGALLGVGLALAFHRWARHPRQTFLRTTVALTALSVVPDAIAEATAASRVVLALTHVIAAAIIVPALARRLAR